MNDNIMPPMEELGYTKSYDFTQYAHDNNVNVIPEDSFKHLIEETFRIIADILRNTYGPYGSTVVISDQSETTTTKDGYNVFNAVGFSHTYKRMVYLAIKKIIDRVNNNVGDGTTSCILLAEKMFREIEKTLKTVDDKRNILKVLTQFEEMIQSKDVVEEDIHEGTVQPLHIDALRGLITVSDNYDDNLAAVIEEALDPKWDEETGIMTSVRNVVVESTVDIDADASSMYKIDYLPGDYRVRCNMDSEVALLFDQPRKIRVALYDHVFSASDWNFFMHDYDKETETLILARSFNRSFMDHEYTKYLKERMMVKQDVKILLAEIKGDFLRDEIKDLAAVIGTEAIGLHAQAVDHSMLPVVNIQVYQGNCMCFDMDEIPDKYIEALKFEMETDTTKSMVKHQLYKDRIRALSKQSKDSLITVHASSSLESKMIADKIDDCISIVNSAMEYGIVPNMLVYGYWRIMRYKHSLDDKLEMEKNVATAIMESIKGLFKDIWSSKHGDQQNAKCDAIMKDLYDSPNNGFDITKEAFVDITTLPTSAQYDLEVIAASISIVKYLLTSRALIFDAHILKPVDDTGRYTPME
jgi:hypothetical protein